MSPSDKAKYTEIYTANNDPHGDVQFSSLEPLYSSLDVPDTDIHSAWNLINPSASPSISKDATLAFLHILNNRHEGYRIPRTVPPSLRASFERNQIDYQVDRVKSPAAQRWGYNNSDSEQYEKETSTGRKAKFGDTYLSRLGLGGKNSYRPSGTDFSSTKTTEDWEEVRLKRQLADLEAKIDTVEREAAKQKTSSSSNGRTTTTRREDASKPALVKRELEQMLEYKRRELRELEKGGGRGNSGEAGELKEVEREIGTVREQVKGLEVHLRRREGVLEGLRRELEEEKKSRSG